VKSEFFPLRVFPFLLSCSVKYAENNNTPFMSTILIPILLAFSHPGGGIYNSTNGVQASELQTLLVDSATLSTATYDSCTCVIVKPHAVKSKTFGTLVCLFFFSLLQFFITIRTHCVDVYEALPVYLQQFVAHNWCPDLLVPPPCCFSFSPTPPLRLALSLLP
jgi:hypothetical protein